MERETEIEKKSTLAISLMIFLSSSVFSLDLSLHRVYGSLMNMSCIFKAIIFLNLKTSVGDLSVCVCVSYDKGRYPALSSL